MARTNHKYDIGETFGDIQIVGKIHMIIRNAKFNGYRVICNKDKHVFDISEHDLNRGRGCPLCTGKIIVEGINDINTTANWMTEYLKNKEDAYKYSKSSGRKITFKCPHCGTERDCTICNIAIRGFVCNVCSDKISMGERLVSALLNELDVKYNYQLNRNILKWCENYRYDFYIPEYNWIIEVNGVQHYKEATGVFGCETLQERIYNDSVKMKLAIENGVSKYIILDFSKNNLEYMKNEILTSELKLLCDKDNIDWNKCFALAMKSYVFVSAEMYNDGFDKECISKKLKVSVKTVNDYLKRANIIGLCEYDTEKMINDARKKGVNAMVQSTSKCVRVLKDGIVLGEYCSMQELARKSVDEFGVKFDQQSISLCCRGKMNHHRKYSFEYVK